MATCKDCIHCDACRAIFEQTGYTVNGKSVIDGAENRCEQYEDKSRFVSLPCNIGDSVYYLGGMRRNRVKTAVVDEIIIDRNGIRDLVVTVDSGTFEMSFGTFYMTRGEAEAAIRERTETSK